MVRPGSHGSTSGVRRSGRLAGVGPPAMTPRPTIILASASPARRALLRAAGVSVEVRVSDVDEDAVEKTLGPVSPAALALALAEAKARDVAAQVDPASVLGTTLVVGADTILDLDGVALGRPHDDADAIRRWHEMRGRAGILLTGHAVIRLDTDTTASAVGSTVVRFGTPTDAEVVAYVGTGEPTSVAGAFTIDGFGGPFIDGIEGDPANVAGLSLPILRRLFAELGVEWTSLWPNDEADRPSRWP